MNENFITGASRPLAVAVGPMTLAITTASPLRGGTVGGAYGQTLQSVEGTGALHWSIAAGKLPGGLSLNASTGRIAGVPTATGTSAVTVRVTDSSSPTPMTATAALSITIHPAIQAALFVANGGNSEVSSFPLGASGAAPPLTALTGAATQLDGTTAVAVDLTGRLYVASAGNDEIAEFGYHATGNVSPSAVISGGTTGLEYPDALAVSATGSLAVADHSSNAVTIYAPGATGNVKPVVSIAGPDTQLDGPAGLTFDTAGDLWVSNGGNSSLTEYPAGAGGDVAPRATITGADTGLAVPAGVVVDAGGNLLVANTFGGSLTEYPVSGNGDVLPLRTITGPSTGLRLPSSVDVDAAGNMYVANELGGVTEFGPGASGNTTPIATLSGPPISGPQAVAVAPPLWVRTRALRAAKAGRRYRAALVAVLGTTPYRWRVLSGHLPAGLTLSRTGILAGRPRRAGTFRFIVRVIDSTRPRMTAARRLVLIVHRNRKASHV